MLPLMSVDKLNLFYQVCGESNRVSVTNRGSGKGGGGGSANEKKVTTQ